MAERADITVDEARELVSNRSLWPLVRDFLWNFAPQIHESWIEGMAWRETLDARRDAGAPNISELMPLPRVRAYILSSLGVEPCFHAFPVDDESRLLLLDGEMLKSIVMWMGALASADALRRVTGGNAVRALKAALSGVYPDIFAYTEYFRKIKIEDLKIEGPDDVLYIGWSMLQARVANLPGPLQRRLVLKLPESFSRLEFSGPPPAVFPTINLQLLLKLRFPEAYKLCCS